MPRRKLFKIPAKDTAIYDTIVSELEKNPELASDYDMTTIEISVKKKFTPRIQNIDQAIENLTRYIAINKQFIEIHNSEALVFKKDIIKMLKVSRPTFDKWIKDGFITPMKSKHFSEWKLFPPEEILKQLQNQKNKK
jgi:predicted DNA-binding transcriptional regulator AlpA